MYVCVYCVCMSVILWMHTRVGKGVTQKIVEIEPRQKFILLKTEFSIFPSIKFPLNMHNLVHKQCTIQKELSPKTVLKRGAFLYSNHFELLKFRISTMRNKIQIFKWIFFFSFLLFIYLPILVTKGGPSFSRECCLVDRLSLPWLKS